MGISLVQQCEASEYHVVFERGECQWLLGDTWITVRISESLIQLIVWHKMGEWNEQCYLNGKTNESYLS